jgi:hypothetical protein
MEVTTLKAYVVEFKGSDWCDFTHATTGQEARKMFWKEWAHEGEFIDIRARRIPELDDIPLTGENIHNAGFDGGWLHCGVADTCHCKLCRGN